MEDNEKKWCKKALIGALIGFGIGAIIKHILLLIVKSSVAAAFLTLIIPTAMIIGISVVYYMYQKEKNDVF